MRLPKLALILLFFSLACTAQVRLEKAGALTDAAVPAAVRNVLDATGSRVLRGDGTPLCDIWLRKSLPAPTGPAAKDVLYPELSPSMMVGVISFPKGAKDYRGQPIKPGFYTLRYELLPEDGNHLGVAPNRDFLLLLPVTADADPNARHDFAQMVKLSAQAAGTNHPATFAMLPPEVEKAPTLSPSKPGGDKGGPPRSFENADSFTVFAATWRTDSGKNVPFELVIKGEAPQ
jgi:hypothetical protein